MLLKIVQTLIVIVFFYFVLKFLFLMLFCTTKTWEKMKKDQIKKEYEEDLKNRIRDDFIINIQIERDIKNKG